MVLLLLLVVAQDQPEPGPIPPGLVRIGKLEIAARKGDAKQALATFVAAHLKHKEGDRDGALQGYLAFLGMPGRHDLPRRYLATVKARIETLRGEVATTYRKAVALYRADRAKGLAELERVSLLYPLLPEGRAALELWHTDRIRTAIDAARKSKDKKALEAAVRRFSSALYMYEAKKLLIEIGGPDLFDRGEKADGDAAAKKKDEDEDEEDATIEIGDG